MIAIFMIMQKSSLSLIRYMRHHHLRHPHNLTRHLCFHYLVKTEIYSDLEFRVFDQPISTDLDHI